MVKDDFFVRIDDVPSLRKQLLFASKNSLESLKIQLRLKEIHKEKNDLKKTLDSQLRVLHSLFNDLFGSLPNHELLIKPKKSKSSSRAKSHKKPIRRTSTVHKKPSSKADIINKALEDIEKRLSSLE